MKKPSLFLSMMLLSCVVTMCFTSCGGDDDDDPVVPQDKATAVEMQAGLYVPENVINYFDVVVTDNAGNKTTLTTSNTEEDATMSFGNMDNSGKAMMLSAISNTGTKLRVYKFGKTTIKSFPASLGYKVSATAKSDVTVGENDKFATCVVWAVDAKNNSKESAWDAFSLQGSISSAVLSGKNWDAIKTKTNLYDHTLSLSFSNAKSLSGSYQ